MISDTNDLPLIDDHFPSAKRDRSRTSKLTVFAVCLAAVLGSAAIFWKPNQLKSVLSDFDEFELFYVENGRASEYEFGSEEFFERFERFKANLIFIREFNAGKHGVVLKPNAFTDLTFNEFQDRYFKHSASSKRPIGHEGHLLKFVHNESLPESIDWRERGCVTEVKDQAKCGSCWAFSTTGAIESSICIHKGGKLVSLSEQELIDCAKEGENNGCNGGQMDDAFKYVIEHGGLCSEESYPYAAKQSKCKEVKCAKKAEIEGVMDIPVSDEKALKAAIANYGPVAAGIEADRPEFQFYHSGVFSIKCGKKLNHAVLVTGYGVEGNETYWVVKNSWGSKWGDKGYIKLASGKHHRHAGECGILLQPSVPLVK